MKKEKEILENKVIDRTHELRIEKDRSETLLLNILPENIAKELKTTGKSEPKEFEEVTVLFTDFKNFTQASEILSAEELVEEINHCYSEFDRIITVNLKSVVLATVAQVNTEYYKLGSFRQDLESKKVSLELASKILKETDARVKAGVMPAMETLNAQYGVSLREKDIIDAEQAG